MNVKKTSFHYKFYKIITIKVLILGLFISDCQHSKH